MKGGTAGAPNCACEPFASAVALTFPTRETAAANTARNAGASAIVRSMGNIASGGRRAREFGGFVGHLEY
jgi:hypothetical protein